MRPGFGVAIATLVLACGGAAPGVLASCPLGQTTLDGTCVSQPIADYVACIRATGATVASNSAKGLSAAAGIAGVTASTQAEVQDKLEKTYNSVSDANALEIIHDCRNKTAPGGEVVGAPSGPGSNPVPVPPHPGQGPSENGCGSSKSISGTWKGRYGYTQGACAGQSGISTLTFTDVDCVIQGTDAYSWRGGPLGSGTISGRRSGANLQWTEVVPGATVSFEGRVVDGVISGFWTGQCGQATGHYTKE
jgi:hypothetical protein